MSLKETIETEYKNALKSKDKTKISTYRLILSSIKDLDIQNRNFIQKKETLENEKKEISKSKDEKLFKKSKEISNEIDEISKQQKIIKLFHNNR